MHGLRRRMLQAAISGLCLLYVSVALAGKEQAAPQTGPWDLEALRKTPAASFGKTEGPVQEVYYEGEPRDGKPTRVFAYYARPSKGDGPFPAMVLVHGGGGKAFAEWAALWAERGYVALAMDLAGKGPDGMPLPDGGPDQGDETKFGDFTDETARDMWTYHAVAAVIRAHSLLASRPEVDAKKTGITGISWGGYLTCIVAGIDDRFKVAVPVYGCGFLDEDSAWLARFAKMAPEQKERWVETFDPSRYLPGVRMPILFVNGTNDFAYPLNSYQKSYRLVPGPVDLCIKVRLPHGHREGWSIPEIGNYVDHILNGTTPPARPATPEIADGKATAKVAWKTPLAKAELHFTTSREPWTKKEWNTVAAQLEERTISAELPPGPVTFFFTVTDERGMVASTPHVERLP